MNLITLFTTSRLNPILQRNCVSPLNREQSCINYCLQYTTPFTTYDLRNWANGFIPRHDNTPCHTSLLVRQFLSNKNITVCPYPPYSPYLAPCEFWIFPKIKMTLKVKRFESIHDIEAATTSQLKTLTKQGFQKCFRKWQERWDNCVRSYWEYFERG